MKFFVLALASCALVSAEQFATGQAARLVIGQDTFTRQLPGATERRLGAVSGLAYANDTLFVVDGSRVQASPQNHRVLLFRQLSSQFPNDRQSIPWDGATRCPLCGGTAEVVLGQPNFTSTDWGIGRSKLRTPTSVATDGRVLAVADTDNNRVLIWNAIPSSINQQPDVVIGQNDFNGVGLNFGGTGSTPSSKGLRGPQGVWIQNGSLYVADTQNHRVLVWNRIPTENGASADLVLGKPNFTTFVQVDLTTGGANATASNLLNPVSVTSDGTRLYVTDLGHNRVLIWNTLPNQNAQPADIALGQPDVTTTADQNSQAANNVTRLCASTGTDSAGTALYPPVCDATLNFPRFALSDGTRLFIADGGNDRVLVYNSVPTRNGQPADVVLGQASLTELQSSDPNRISSADSIRTPMSLAWDGRNLYAADPFNRRVLAWSLGDQVLPATGVRNAASQDIYAVGALRFSSNPKENDEVTVKIGDLEYKYKALKDETLSNVITGLAALINGGAGNSLVFATPNVSFGQILLTSRKSGVEGNTITFTATYSTGAQLAGDASGTLQGGQDAAQIAPGALVLLVGENLAEQEASAPEGADKLPTALGGVELYFDGIRAPLMYVSPTRINAQMPWEVNDSSSVNAYVRTTDRNGQVRVTNAIAVPIIPQNPGIFADEGTDPRRARALHGSSYATGAVQIDGTIKENDVATVRIEDRDYNYTVKAGDSLASVRDALINLINENSEEKATAAPAFVYTRILLRARVEGDEGEGISYTASVSTGATIILSPLSSALSGANKEGAPITEENPAVPGETILIYATGLGFVQPDEAKYAVLTGEKYTGPLENTTNSPIDAIAGARTANVLFAGLVPGQIGVYEIRLQLNPDIPTNPQTQLTIAQDIYISNIVTFPVVNPNTPEE